MRSAYQFLWVRALAFSKRDGNEYVPSNAPLPMSWSVLGEHHLLLSSQHSVAKH
jgi:hypothetical protein